MRLTKREADVMALIKQGLGNKAIARQLNISVCTVSVYVRTLLRKTGACNRTQAAMRAMALDSDQGSIHT